MEHSPLPWDKKCYSIRMGQNSTYNILNDKRLTVCGNCRESDANFIIEACNNYDRLKEENEQLKELLKRHVFRKMVPATCTDKIQTFECREEYNKAINIVYAGKPKD